MIPQLPFEVPMIAQTTAQDWFSEGELRRKSCRARSVFENLLQKLGSQSKNKKGRKRRRILSYYENRDILGVRGRQKWSRDLKNKNSKKKKKKLI